MNGFRSNRTSRWKERRGTCQYFSRLLPSVFPFWCTTLADCPPHFSCRISNAVGVARTIRTRTSSILSSKGYTWLFFCFQTLFIANVLLQILILVPRFPLALLLALLLRFLRLLWLLRLLLGLLASLTLPLHAASLAQQTPTCCTPPLRHLQEGSRNRSS